MKEEMCELFEFSDPFLARTRWKAWFEAAKASGIEPLAKFTAFKEKRRFGYGFRDDAYFFSLIHFLSIPSVRLSNTIVA